MQAPAARQQGTRAGAPVTLDTTVPSETRKVRLDVAARSDAGGSTHPAWDDIEANIS
jgi:hypothetical protein